MDSTEVVIGLVVGSGYYNKILRTYLTALSIGIAFSVQGVENIPAEAHDVTLDLIITKKEVIKKCSQKVYCKK
ncbi:MAG: hypothetical protein MTP17_03620 [Candidatus Midichloria sp.]|nr:MAG: hypothetical protein MTP17_03620 [Candidatus Midichloria sp.]